MFYIMTMVWKFKIKLKDMIVQVLIELKDYAISCIKLLLSLIVLLILNENNLVIMSNFMILEMV